MHSSQHCCVFRIIFIVLSRVVVVLSPRTTAPLFGAVMLQILWHLYLTSPEARRAAKCRISAGVQSGQSVGQGKRVWYGGGCRGDRMSLCASAAFWDMEAFQTQLKGELWESKGCLLSSVTALTDWKHVVPLLHPHNYSLPFSRFYFLDIFHPASSWFRTFWSLFERACRFCADFFCLIE